MFNTKTKAPCNSMEFIQLKLFDFVPEFSEYREFEDLSRVGCGFY